MFRRFAITILAMLSFFLVACSGVQTETLSEEEVIKEFLYSYWTQDAEGRYQAFAEGSVTSDVEEMKKVTKTYYESVEQYVTEEVLEELMANRMPYKYEALADQRDASYAIQDVQLEEKEGGIYHFEITFLWQQEGQEDMTVSVSGDVRAVEEKGEWKIGYYYESNVFTELEW